MKRCGVGLSVACAMSVAACINSAGTDPSGPSCRTYATAGTHAYTGPGFLSAAFTSNYDAATNRLTMQVRATGTTGTIYDYTYVTSYQSAADFVDELAVNPPRTLATSVVTSGASDSTTTHSYDAERRLTSATYNWPGFAPDVTNFTAWDANGRPTVGSNVGPGYTLSIQRSYDDATRTAVSNEKQTQAALSPLMTYSQSYTAEGEPLLRTETSDGVLVASRTTTITATAEVCK